MNKALAARTGVAAPVKNHCLPRELLICSLGCCVPFISCKKESPIAPSIAKDPRTYTWTVDTIDYPGRFELIMRELYGSSAHDIYVVGHNAENKWKMLHYDGTAWSPVALTPSEGGPIPGTIDLLAVDGIGSNNIWAVGDEIHYNPITRQFSDSSLVIHYDGVSWRKVPIERGRSLQAVTAFRSDFVLAGGINGTCYEFDGSSWTLVHADTMFWFSNFGTDGQNIFGLAYTPSTVTHNYEIIYQLEWVDSTWRILDSTSITSSSSARFGHEEIKRIGEGTYSVGYGIFEQVGDGWERVAGLNGEFGRISGTKRDHIFVVGWTVLYHDSQGWVQLDVPGENTWGLSGVWCSEDEVFIVGSNGGCSFIIHGK